MAEIIARRKSVNDEIKTETLGDHTKRMLNLGLRLGKEIYHGDGKSAFLSALASAIITHDIGKCNHGFQKYINSKKCYEEPESDESESIKKNWIKHQHHVYSWAFAATYINKGVASSVLYHHTVSENLDKILSTDLLNDLDIEVMTDFYDEMGKYAYKTLGVKPTPIKECEPDDISGPGSCSCFPNYFSRDKMVSVGETMNDAKHQLIRAVLIYSDRTCAKYAFRPEADRIGDNDTAFIDKLISGITTNKTYGFDYSVYSEERLSEQKALITEINASEKPCTVLGAPCGYGKTLVGLMWASMCGKKVIWVTPRNIIAQSTYISIREELDKMKRNDVCVGLYVAGTFESNQDNVTDKNMNDCDILVTNIDNFLSRSVKNNVSHTLVNLYASNVIFDEFHEFVEDAPLFSAFVRIVNIRNMFTKSKTLMLSATPNNSVIPLFEDYINTFYYHDLGDNLFGSDIKVTIHVEKNDNFKLKPNSFVICSIVNKLQELYKKKCTKNDVLIHNRFTESDRRELEKTVYERYGEGKSTEHVCVGNVIGVGLNISCENVYDYCIKPEDTIQRCCGRSSRFHEHDTVHYHVRVYGKSSQMPNNILKINSFIHELYEKWVGILAEYDGKTVTKSELYGLYYKFLEDNKKEIGAMYLRDFLKSSNRLSYIKPYKAGVTSVENARKKSSRLGFRGENNEIFVSAPDENGNWSEAVSILKYKFENEYSRKDEKELLNILKKRFGLTDKELQSAENKTGNTLINLALSSLTPFPILRGWKYSKVLGLYEEDTMTQTQSKSA